MICFDPLQPGHASSVRKWWEVAQKHNENRKLLGCLVATKMDSEERQAVNIGVCHVASVTCVSAPLMRGVDEVRNHGAEEGLELFKTGAASNLDVELPFQWLAEKWSEHYENERQTMTAKQS